MAPRISEVRGAEVKTEDHFITFHSARAHRPLSSCAHLHVQPVTGHSTCSRNHSITCPACPPCRHVWHHVNHEENTLSFASCDTKIFVIETKNICYTVLTLLGSGTASTLAPVVPLPVPIFTRQMAQRGRGF